VTAISADELNASLANNLQDAIKAEPGVEMSGTGKFGLGSFSIRGMTDDRVKILIDGIEQAVFFKAGRGTPHTTVINEYSSQIELDTLKAIEINKNSASSLYGSDAIGGAVLLRTKSPDDILEGQAQATNVAFGYGGANQGMKNTWEAAIDVGDWQGMMIYTFRDEAETQTHGAGSDEIGVMRGQADPADYTSHNLLLKSVNQLTPNQTLAITGEVFRKEGDTDLWSMEGYFVPARRGGKDTYYTANRLESEQSRWRVTLAHEWRAEQPLFDMSQWQLSWQQAATDNTNFRVKNTDCLGGCALIRDREDSHLQLHGQFDKTLSWDGAEQDWSYGLSVVRSEFDSFFEDQDIAAGTVAETSTTMPQASAVRAGLFAKQQLAFDLLPLKWNFGLRYDLYRTDPAADLPKHESDVITYNTGLIWTMTESLSGYVSVGSGYRAPSLYDLYYRLDLPHAIVMPNENLEAERSTNSELGLRWTGDGLQAELAWYYSDYRDFIDSVTDDSVFPAILQYQNVGEAWIRGVELKAFYSLASWIDGGYLRASAAWSEGENRRTGRALDSVSPFNSTLTLGYNAPSGSWGAELFAKYSAAKQGDDWTLPDNLSAPDYVYLDALAWWQASPRLKLQLGIMNLTDEKYWLYGNLAGLEADPQLNPDRLTQPGLHVNAAVHYRF
ncbi:MAG: TonB-dependent hemoglobin/transferrin/lactoferrin family receptor, partial [Shewanella sp.]